ncbi:serine/threonine-protein kinase [Anabaena sp. PCC 7938]|nr:serine/threonine-protein kinase [Anabaena sp. CCAP 1446/1C]MBY5284821.1 serine/threonine protein kinase [Anabaena sp. CCAP 1446/1C]MBY5308802.1 serine/threonine protein kinase [Anabaena sp. CCAP 1446/1C]
MPADPNTGRLLNKRYQLQELIGIGAMGRVYRAKDNLLGGVPVAIKFLAISIQNEKMRLQERFEREAKTCALLGQKSLHIVRVMDYGVDENNTPYYVMEYLQGKSLSDVIRDQNLSLSRFLSMSRQICLGLQCAHNGIPVDGSIYSIIHRDIKPSNMLVVQDDSFGELVKVLDFGIAKLMMSDGDQTKFYLGTLAYSSPEQIEGKELDNRSDIYSLGVMMFEMLTAKLPLVPSNHSFGAWYQIHKSQKPKTFAEVNPTLRIPKQVEDLVMSCLEKKPSDRPQSINEILSVLVSAEQQDKIRKKASENTPALNPNFIAKQQIEPEKKPTTSPLASPVVEKIIKTELRVSPISDDMSRTTSWPLNKPIADIVFPQPIYNNGEVLPALWVMLPEQEIQKRLVCTRYNQFLFISVPHPMLLWITVIYNRQHGAKWLPYYVDLKTNFGQEIVRLLQHTGHYRLLFFARETPTHCTHILPSSIAPVQCQRLKDWLEASKISTSSADAQVSKTFLKQEYEKIKPQILARLQTMDTDSPFDLSG